MRGGNINKTAKSLAGIILLSFLFFSCEEDELRSPVGNWFRSEYYWVQSGVIDTVDTTDDGIYIQITDSTFTYYVINVGLWGGVASTLLGCKIDGDRITTYNPFVDSVLVGVEEMYYSYSGENLILESVSFPENHGDFRQVLLPHPGNLPPD